MVSRKLHSQHFRISSKQKTIDISNFNSAVLKLVSDHETKVVNQVKCAACNVDSRNVY